MSDTVRKIHPRSKKIRVWGKMMPTHQIPVKALDVPRGLYEKNGRGDAWGMIQTRCLKVRRRRAIRYAGRRLVVEELGLIELARIEAERVDRLAKLAEQKEEMYRQWDEYERLWREDFGMN